MTIPHRNSGTNARPRLARFTWLPRLMRLSLGIEITLVLLLKAALLVLLWTTFFSAPQARKMRMPTPLVEQHLLTPPQPQATPDVHSASPSPVEAVHDSDR